MSPDPATETPSVGNGRYTLTERIATGGMGVVWRAHDIVLGRDVAVKILKGEYADDATFRARLQAEARNTAGLHHPAIAQVFDFGDVVDPGSGRGTTYLVMELVPGEPLSAVIGREGPLAPERAADVVAQAATAIDAAHQRGVVHRDVKPANLIVTPAGAVKVTDFGIARAADAVPLTETGQVIGTPHYLSPEQARGLPATPASDIYGLGVVLYECLSGSRPFSADSPVAVAMQHLRDPAPPLPDTVPPALASLCLRALAKEPQERPGSAAELAAHLRHPEWSSPVPPVGAVAGAGEDAGGAAGAPTRDQTAVLTGTGTPPSAHRRRPGWLVPLAVAAAVLLLLGGVALALTAGEGDEPPAAGTRDGGAGQASAGSSPDRVQVDPADYRGRPFPAARDDLRTRGFEVDRAARVGTGGEPGTVDYVQPHGMLAPGTTVTLGVWQAPPDDSGDTGAGGGQQRDAEGAGDASGSEEKGKSDDTGKSGDTGKSDDKGKSGLLEELPGGADKSDDDGES